MINICTVHHKTQKWISPQLLYLSKNINTPYRIFSIVPDHVNPPDYHYSNSLDTSTQSSFDHSIKLNFLSDIVLSQSKPDDILLFLDGDAFPINPLMPILTLLAKYDFISIVRTELGDCFPHPSFAMCRVEFWLRYLPSWLPGFSDINNDNNPMDSGGYIFNILKKNNLKWHRLFRSNKRNIHSLWFGIYDDIIYHHGAGFRSPVSKLDIKERSTNNYINSEEFKGVYQYSDKLHQRIIEDPLFFHEFI